MRLLAGTRIGCPGKGTGSSPGTAPRPTHRDLRQARFACGSMSTARLRCPVRANAVASSRVSLLGSGVRWIGEQA